MPETTAPNTPESDLAMGALASAPGLAVDPASYWQSLLADPCFIVTGTTAPSREVALADLLEAVKAAADQAPGSPIILAEGWPAVPVPHPTASDMAVWKKKIEVYNAQYLALAGAVQTAYPALEIQIFPLASELAKLLELPALSALDPAEFFSAEAPQGTPALSALAVLLTTAAQSETPLPDSLQTADAWPVAWSDAYPEISAQAHVAVGGILHRPAVTDPDTPPSPTDPDLVTHFIGTEGDDLIDLSADLIRVEGGAGTDTLAVAALSETASITFGSNGRVQLDLAGRAPVVLQDVERIAFEDGTLAFDDDGLAGQAYRLYQACFDRTPDIEGLGFWIKQLDAGNVTLTEAANFFIGSEEFANVYGAPEALADVHYLALLYANVLDRLPDSEGFGFWREQQENGVTRADMLVYFSESTENIARVATAIDDGIWYV